MVRRVLAGAAVAAVLLSGCGIPDESGITVVGPGPSTGTSSGDGSMRSRITRDSTSDRAQFVLNYLKAAAGDYDTALDRVKQFMSSTARAEFNAPATPRVIRLTSPPLVKPAEDSVEISYQLVGTLGKNGVLEPAAEAAEGKYDLVLSEAAGDGLYVRQAPPFLLLSDTALQEFYDERTIYFWNTEHTGLVPDVRHLLTAVPVEQEPTILLNWLIGGPAPWLQDAVEPLPEGTKLEGNIPAKSADRLQIKLSAQALPTENADDALDWLRRQLQWSLRRLLPKFLELTVGHQETRSYSGFDFMESNPANRLGSNPERYVVYDRVIRRVVDQGSSEPDRPAVASVPGLSAETNRDVSRAALSATRTHTLAALVTGSGKNERLRVGSAPVGGEASLQEIPGLPTGMGHPIWAITPESGADGAIGLIVADGQLWRFAVQGGPAQPVSWPGLGGPITAITVAPDGHRVALTAGGRLYRAVLTVSGDGLALTGLQQLATPFSSVSAVDFSSEGWLTVAGVRRDTERVSIMGVSVDGGLRSEVLPDMGKEPVTYVTSYPAHPVTGRQNSGAVLYSTGRRDAWEALSTAVPIDAGDLAGTTGEPRPDVVPEAPFFLN
ncbi:hypothetical protein QLQ12_06800 [Actinoplanes sp. NEAU-A12]|uniref:GerMN domain-containing protein n=1 Tax=Actinoplanes sandaracinus TaxID=3045177 RepID=A0ABT6WEZ4_9ACTN|nr:LpqB family beta-propeller domain-containing protein [Actinoplanes sandaracinus]MDI6098309.1 hypothetical protein [Actinoplanes sandaracinus]